MVKVTEIGVAGTITSLTRTSGGERADAMAERGSDLVSAKGAAARTAESARAETETTTDGGMIGLGRGAGAVTGTEMTAITGPGAEPTGSPV